MVNTERSTVVEEPPEEAQKEEEAFCPT